MSVNSRSKGKRGELEVVRTLRDYGYDARRGNASIGEPDVVDGPEGYHLEVKRREREQTDVWLEQSIRDAKNGEVPLVIHRKSGMPWKVTLLLSNMLELIKEVEDLRMKNSFIFHLDSAEDLEDLTDTELAAIFRAMIRYQSTGEEPEFEDRLLQAVWRPMRRRMDADNEAYEAKCEVNRENAKKGGAPKGNQNAKKDKRTVEKTTENKRTVEKTTENNPKQAKQPDYDIDTDSDTEIDIDIQKEKPTNVGLKKTPPQNPSVVIPRARSGTKYDDYIADYYARRRGKA